MEKPQYPEDRFERFAPKWDKEIESGRLDPNKLISAIEKEYIMTEIQRMRIKNMTIPY